MHTRPCVRQRIDDAEQLCVTGLASSLNASSQAECSIQLATVSNNRPSCALCFVHQVNVVYYTLHNNGPRCLQPLSGFQNNVTLREKKNVVHLWSSGMASTSPSRQTLAASATWLLISPF